MFAAIRAGQFMAARKHDLRGNKMWRSLTHDERAAHFNVMFTDECRAKFRDICGPDPENLATYKTWLHERGTDYGATMDEEMEGTIADHVEHRQRRLNGRAFMKAMEGAAEALGKVKQ